MKFISAEEFLKQDEDVQRVFTDYFDHKEILFEDGSIYFGLFDCPYNTPLLTEGDLREFIEGKTGCKVVLLNNLALTIEIWITNKYGNKRISTGKHDVLQAYWKIAIEIAKNQTSIKGYKNRW